MRCTNDTQELYSHYSQQVKDTSLSLADPHKAYLLRKAMHFFNTQRTHAEQQGRAARQPVIEVRPRVMACARACGAAADSVHLLRAWHPPTCCPQLGRTLDTPRAGPGG